MFQLERDSWGKLILIDDGGRRHAGIVPVRGFPISDPHHFVSICDAAGHELVCGECGRVQFPRTDPAVIMAITYGEAGSPREELLLGRQAAWPPGRFSTLAGFVEPGESLEDAVRREVLEEVGVPVGEVEYFGNQAWPFPSSLMLGLTGRAQGRELSIDHHEIEEAHWFTRAELLEASQSGEVLIPQGVSISSSLVQHWFGGSLPAPGEPAG